MGIKPPKSAEKCSVWLQLPPADHQRLREAAAKSGMPMSEFSRQAVTDAAEKILAKSAK